MKILNRYILKEAVVFFLINLFTFTGILLTVRMLTFAALIINKGVEPKFIVEIFIAIIPTFLEIAIPMAALLGVMLAFARMSGDSEIIVMRGIGISLLQLLRPIFLLALIFSAISFFISMSLSPWGNYQLGQSLFEIAQNKSTSGLHAGVFNKLGKITLYSEEIDDNSGDLRRILIDDKREENSRKIILAQTGKIVSNPADRSIILVLNDGYIHETINGSYSLTNFNNNNLLIDFNEINQSEDNSQEKRSREMYLPELHSERLKYLDYEKSLKEVNEDFTKLPAESTSFLEGQGIGTMGQLKRKIRRLETESGRRFSMPFATFVLTLLGLPLGIIPPRTQKSLGIGLSVTTGLAVFTIYYVLLSLGITLGENGKIPVYLGLWLPNIVALTICIYAIHKVTTEKWSSIAHGVEIILGKLSIKNRLSA
jgi:lipopolysaccharide export system permease protein